MRYNEIVNEANDNMAKLANVAERAFIMFKNHPLAKWTSNARPPEKEGERYVFEFRDWGRWENDIDDYDDEDSDWQVPSSDTTLAIEQLCETIINTYKDVKVTYQVGEKNYISVFVSL